MKLNVTIDSEDAAATEAPDVLAVGALRHIANAIDRGKTDGIIHDWNGNKVGQWDLEVGDDDE